jgi:4-amino-4-deoxy-L-arabinose transferase-like glycosyltransferase
MTSVEVVRLRDGADSDVAAVDQAPALLASEARAPSGRFVWAWRFARVEMVLLAAIMVLAAVFRLPGLDRVPNGFFVDEASRGYDAYSLLWTGHDQYGVAWPLFAEGLEDYTPTLYTLLVVPSIALLGLTETAVRLPAALAGLATIVMTHLVGRAFFGPAVGLVAALFVAISPWQILPSRTGAEWVLLPLFLSTGIWLLHRGRTSGPALLLAGLVLGVGLYSYAFARLLVPLLIAGFALLWWRDLARQRAWCLLGLAVLAGLALPIVQFGLTPAGQARLRAVVPLDRYRGLALVPYFVGNLASYFNPTFLIGGNEPTDYHRLRGIGPVLWVMLPGLVATVASVVRRPSRELLFWIWWIVAAPMSAALHRESPSSVLLLGAIPAWQVLAAVGTVRLVIWAHNQSANLGRITVTAATVGVVATIGIVAYNLYAEYPVYAADDWQYGARETIAFLEEHQSEYDDVLVSDRLVAPHLLVLFYGRVDPAAYEANPIHVRQPNVRSRGNLGQYRFDRLSDLLQRPGRHLVWATPEDVPSLPAGLTPLLTVNLPDGRPAQRVFATPAR